MVILLFIVISLVLTGAFFQFVTASDFLHMGDQYFPLSLYETVLNSNSVIRAEYLGIHNGYQLTTQFWDSTFYSIIYRTGLSFLQVEKLLIFVVLLGSLILTYIGMYKLGMEYFKSKRKGLFFFVSLWYCFNPYTTSLWHGGVYNIGSALTYALAPMATYLVIQVIFKSPTKKLFLICALVLFVQSFTFWLFAPFLLFLFILILMTTALNPKKVFSILKNCLLLFLTYLPLVVFILFNIAFELIDNTTGKNSLYVATFTNQVRGLFYPIMLIFSWGIYTVWTPRSLYSFGKFFFSQEYKNTIFLLYSLVSWQVIKTTLSAIRLRSFIFSHKLFFTIFVCLGVSLFLAKGPQEPLGSVFIYLYEHIPFFSVFRTPDIRFGFTVILSLSLLLLSVSNKLVAIIISSILLFITIVQGQFFINGIVVTGEDIPGKYIDRIVSLSKDQKDIATFFESKFSPSDYIITLPSIEYGMYRLDDGDLFVGQDLIPKIINNPFIYVSASKGISSSAYDQLESILSSKSLDKLSAFPIRYAIIRNDIDCDKCQISYMQKLSNNARQVYANKTYLVYELPDYARIVEGVDIQYDVANPTNVSFRLNNLADTRVVKLNYNYSKNWNIYADKATSTNSIDHYPKFNVLNDIKFLFKRRLKLSNNPESTSYSNSWVINKSEIISHGSSYFVLNNDGSVNVNLVAFYTPQIYYSLFFVVTWTFFILYSSYLFFLEISTRIKCKKKLFPRLVDTKC